VESLSGIIRRPLAAMYVKLSLIALGVVAVVAAAVWCSSTRPRRAGARGPARALSLAHAACERRPRFPLAGPSRLSSRAPRMS